MTKIEEKGQGTPARKYHLGLTSIILISLGLGIICGVIFTTVFRRVESEMMCLLMEFSMSSVKALFV